MADIGGRLSKFLTARQIEQVVAALESAQSRAEATQMENQLTLVFNSKGYLREIREQTRRPVLP